MIATILQLVGLLLIVAGVSWSIMRWPQLCEAVRYEIEMRRVKRARRSSARTRRIRL